MNRFGKRLQTLLDRQTAELMSLERQRADRYRSWCVSRMDEAKADLSFRLSGAAISLRSSEIAHQNCFQIENGNSVFYFGRS